MSRRAGSAAATRMNDGSKLEEWRRLRARVKAEDRDDEPGVLAPPEAFTDMRGTADDRARFGMPTPPEQTGPASAAVARRITKSCAGWRRPPTTREFFEAVHATDPTDRQATIIGMWLREAPIDEVLLACAEEAYTLRELIAAIHRTGNAHRHPARNRELNRLARAR